MAINNKKFLKDKLSIIDEEESLESQGKTWLSHDETESELEMKDQIQEKNVFKYDLVSKENFKQDMIIGMNKSIMEY